MWRPPSVSAALDLRYVLSHLDRGGRLLAEETPARAGGPAPGDRPGHAGRTQPPVGCCPSLLGPAEKRVLDLLSDWPWASTSRIWQV